MPELDARGAAAAAGEAGVCAAGWPFLFPARCSGASPASGRRCGQLYIEHLNGFQFLQHCLRRETRRQGLQSILQRHGETTPSPSEPKDPQSQ